MTNKELLIELWHEATSEDKERLAFKVEFVRQLLEQEKPGSAHAFDKAFDQAEADFILPQMRQQKAEIAAWFAWLYARARQT